MIDRRKQDIPVAVERRRGRPTVGDKYALRIPPDHLDFLQREELRGGMKVAERIRHLIGLFVAHKSAKASS
jgi:hypothetical protein